MKLSHKFNFNPKKNKIKKIKLKKDYKHYN